MIELRSVVLRYGAVVALDGLDLEVASFLLGPYIGLRRGGALPWPFSVRRSGRI